MFKLKIKKIPSNQGITSIILILVGLTLSAILIGLFVSSSRKPSQSVTPVNPSPAEIVCGLVVSSPKPNQTVGDGSKIKGTVNGCGWNAFEAQAGTVIAFMSDGTSISQPIPLMAVGEWMQKTVNFEANLSLDIIPPPGEPGFLLFRNEDASGENPKIFKVLVNY